MAFPIDLCRHRPHNGGVPQTVTMTASISRDSLGTSAFTKEGRLVMTMNQPTVAWSFRIVDLERWMTTLETVLDENPGNPHCSDLICLLCSLKAAHGHHVEQHHEVVTEAPTADDQIAYLAAYAAAIGNGGLAWPTNTAPLLSASAARRPRRDG